MWRWDTDTICQTCNEYCRIIALRLVVWNVGDESFSIGRFLNGARGASGIYDEAVDHDIPGHWIAAQPAGQRPFGIHQTNFEKVANDFGFGGRTAFADVEIVADVRGGDVGRLAFVEGEVDGGDGVDDAGGPVLRPSAGEGRRPFAAQFGGHQTAHVGVLVVQHGFTKTVG